MTIAGRIFAVDADLSTREPSTEARLRGTNDPAWGSRCREGYEVRAISPAPKRGRAMSTPTVARSDHDIQIAVQDELDWTPDVDAAGIDVAVEDGAVILIGEVDQHSERLAAKRAARRVRGVSTVVDALTVHPKSSITITDTDVAREVRRALQWADNVPDTVRAEVSDHNVILTGEVLWDFQRGNRATLSGHVRSWGEKEQAGRAAWASPHITEVENNVRVKSD